MNRHQASWVLLLALLVGSSPPARAQQGPALALPETVQRMLNPAAPVDAAAAEALPVPPVTEQHLIPIAGTPAPDAVRVESEAGLVSLVARDAPLGQVLALLAETQKLNLVFAGSGEAHVTVALDKVPVETALDAVLATSGHTWTRNGNIVHITSVAAEGGIAPHIQGRRVQVFDLDYATSADIDLTVKGLLSPVGKSWTLATSPTDTRRTREAVVVEDLPEYVDRIAAYIVQADQPPGQVLIEVQILEVDLKDDRKRGVNLEEIASLGGTGITFSTTGFADQNAPQAFFVDIQGGDLSGLVELLQSTTDAKTLASPKLLALNGQEAKLQIGEKLGYRVTTTTQTSTLESVDFIEVGVVLTVTPYITRDGRVMLKVKPKVSDGSVNATTGLPEEQTTEVETNVVLGHGQGIVLGGLIQERDSVVQNQIPLLGDIPYAGVLFQRRNANKARSEIVVALMPHLLPYDCERQAQNDFDVMRAREKLTYGALCSHPRDYEPKMPEALGDCHLDRSQCGPPQLRRLPPIDGCTNEVAKQAPTRFWK